MIREKVNSHRLSVRFGSSVSFLFIEGMIMSTQYKSNYANFASAPLCLLQLERYSLMIFMH